MAALEISNLTSDATPGAKDRRQQLTAIDSSTVGFIRCGAFAEQEHS